MNKKLYNGKYFIYYILTRCKMEFMSIREIPKNEGPCLNPLSVAETNFIYLKEG